jgi:TonB family protein
MRKGTFIASILVITATLFAEPQPGSGFGNFSNFKQQADSMNEAGLRGRNREKIEAIREQEMSELGKRPADKNGNVAKPVESGIEKTTLQQKMAALQPKWTECYQSLPDEEKRQGDVQLAFDITPKGAVSNERVLLESSLRSKALRDCMLKALRATRFPARKSPTKVTSYPISFTPQSPAE